jgi:outer membrane biosynthesis protein TonB
MKQLILAVSFLTLVGGFRLHAQPGQKPDGNSRGDGSIAVPPPPQEQNVETLPPEAQNIGILESIEYPSWAIRKNIHGEVKVRVLVDANGRYMKHEVMIAPIQALADLVCNQLPDLRFSPAEKEKRPVEGWTAISVFFEIPDNARSRQAGIVRVSSPR